MRSSFLLIVAGLLIGSPALADNLRITVVSAKLDQKKLKKTAKRSRESAPFSDLNCYSSPGLRSIAESCGVRMAADGVTAQPPKALPNVQVDPMVRIEWRQLVLRTYPVPATLTPRWDYSLVIDESVLKDQGDATIILYDWVGQDAEVVLGRAKVKANDLMKEGEHKTKVGAATIVWKVERLKSGTAPRVYKYSVPADKQIADLAREAATAQKKGEYIAVPVAEGEIVEITASGKVQPNAKKYPGRKAGPNGIPTIKTKVQYNQPGFRDGQNHAALIGQLGSRSMMVGAEKKFTARTSGFLILALNDLKTADNGGAFDVEVKVSVPAAVDQSKFKKRGSRLDSGPASLSPRVVQQIVDSHAHEFGECFQYAADPSGDVLLQFLITADGRPIVSVSEASDNLTKVADCMAETAGGWKFPQPRGTVVVRYPMHLEAQ